MKSLPIVVLFILLAAVFVGLLAGVLVGHRSGSTANPPPSAIRH